MFLMMWRNVAQIIPVFKLISLVKIDNYEMA